MNKIKNFLNIQLATIFGTYFSLDKKLKKATAQTYFVEGQDNLESSIQLNLNGITYFFEGKPIVEEYKNNQGEKVTRKTLKYGGWGIDLRAKENKIF